MYHFASVGRKWAALAGVAITAQSMPVVAQYVSPSYPQAYAPPSDADALASQMRTLAGDPNNLYALIAAGNLSLKLGDGPAAAALFQRADKIDPANARVKAGMAATLVQSERPGEALQLFAQAQRLGLNESEFAIDRALAYDLIGEQERAQRVYRMLLRGGPDDEVVRRYALSLGISGKKDDALALLEPLNRKSDRGAWRARAFVLAMNGDRAGAERIATTMMPPGMAEGLQPFFARLPGLPAVDRAFAVHFGEVRGTPARYAEIRLAPPLPSLPYEAPLPSPVTRVAVAPPEEKRGKKPKRGQPAPVRVAATPVAPPLPPPPTPSAVEVARVGLLTAPAPSYPSATLLAGVAPPRRAPTFVETTPQMRGGGAIARASAADAMDVTEAVPLPVTSAAPPPAQVAGVKPAPASVVPAASPVTSAPVQLAAITQTKTALSSTAAVPVAIPPEAATLSPAVLPSVPPVGIAAKTVSATPIGPVDEGTPPAPVTEARVTNDTPAPAPAPAPAVPEPVPAAAAAATADIGTPPAPSGPKGDAILAAIVASIAIPESERAPVAVLPKLDPKAEARAKAAAKAKADAKLAALAEAKKKADDLKIARAQPSRIWVQVAGGANEATLGKEWQRVSSQAAALKGRQSWTTPLRATNRVLTGPFKSSAEAMALVNTLKQQGVAAFMFTSDAGQKVDRLGTR